MKLLLASSNVHKLRELREMFKPIKGLDLYSLLDFPAYKPPEESGETFEANAILKATDAAKHLNMLTVADDSGLVVPSIGGLPGVRSHRFAGEDPTDQENRSKLLSMLEQSFGDARNAYFECVIAVAKPEGLLKTVRGRVEGFISPQEKGRSGFGYDPIFIKHDYDRTFAELDEATKNKVSHRRKAFEKLLLFLEAM
jgi:XTP/dITP diphosphohydrolase